METVLGLVVVGIIYSVVFVVKSVFSKNPGVDAKPVMTEVFPEIKMYEQPFLHEETLLHQNQKKKKAVKAVSKEQPHGIVKKEIPVEEKKEHGKFSINGKSEAKRAFIYSEIFNRKY